MSTMMRLTLLLAWTLLLPAITLAGTALVNPNLASKQELQALAHVDAGVAEAIVAGRPYLSASDLDAALAASMDGAQREALYGQLFRRINLNNASEAEILLIPGMSRKMAHEFEEYRPYTSMEQFRREIGKYVDDDEVARLESYVTLN
jgi:DNA uptake protein ComE-like DNA-binding protein